MIELKLLPLDCKQRFPLLTPGNLVFNPTWPILDPDLKIIKTNIQIEFH